ncbi:MAG: DsrE family protein [Deltaproteobacteria bacterium]|nr:DsrE family protein [Deltaproteobacteria bacterium]MBW1923836.1 DsrE family protein [Deltaproteobacteria bacterium]MBW1948553.1 DsrE family protein [Deltaproteobacteria bacterium]MBW2006981.1 DsrE family protein [Deltaproteobacteria bacterium]MBW2102303.1 DsrE family protein [Deltaproteobacteria bacterium]
MTESKAETLVVIWSSADRDVARNMVFMYTLNSRLRGWWDEVRLVVWGPSSKLLTQDKELQEALAEMKEAGVRLLACKACADSYGVSEDLERLGLEVRYMGEPLTRYLKEERFKILTF